MHAAVLDVIMFSIFLGRDKTMDTRIFKRIGVFLITVVIFVGVLAPCFNLGERDVNAAAARTYTSMVKKSRSLGDDQTLDYYLVEPNTSGKHDVVVLFSGINGVGPFEESFRYYASKWMATKQLKPYVFVIPILEKYGTGDYFGYFMDKKINGKTKMEYVMEMIRDGSISGKANPKCDITVAGYSFGGCASLYAGILYKDKIHNIGGISPSYLVYTGDNRGWFKNKEDLVFSSSSKRHLFMSASKVENEGGIYTCMQRYIANFQTPFVTKTYEKGEHKMVLFQEEIFNFLYYCQHDKLPSSSVVKAMNNVKLAAYKNGWKKENGKWYYYKNNKKQKSKFITTDGKKYYVGKTGARVYGWKKIKGKYYYFKKKTGVMKTGWLKIGKKKYCLSSSGPRYTGWHTIGGKTYYFYKKTGVMAKNKKIGKYRVGKDGVRK